MADAAKAKKAKVVDPAKAKAREAKMLKRKVKLNELKTKDPVLLKCKVDFKTAKDMGLCTDGAGYCRMKGDALKEWWYARATKPILSDKKLAKKQAKREKLLKMLQELEKETAE